MQQEFLFEYNHSKDKPVHNLVTVAFIGTVGLAISIIVYLIVAVFVETFFSRHVSIIFGIFVFIAFLLFMRINTLKYGVKRITISNQEIRWETSRGEHFSINNKEVFEINWQHHKILFNQEIELSISALSFKHKISLHFVLSKLFPLALNDAEDLYNYTLYNYTNLSNFKSEQAPISFEVGRQSRRWLYIIGGIFLTLLIFSVFWNLVINFQGFTNLLIILGGYSLAAYIIAWFLSTYRALHINNEGILYQKANYSQFFKWHEIEAIEIHTNNSRGNLDWKILIWKNDKHVSISFRKTQMSAEKIHELHDVITFNALSRNIPFGVH